MKFSEIRFAPGQEITFAYGKRRISRVNSNGTVALVCSVTGEEFQTSLPELTRLHLEGKAKLGLGPDGAVPANDKFRRRTGPVDSNRQALVARRIAYVNPLVALGQVGPKHPVVATCIGEVAKRIEDKSPPAPWTAYRWVRRYRTSGFDSDVLARDAMFIRTRKPKVPVEVKQAIARHLAQLLAAYKEASLHSVTDLALALTARDLGKEYFRDKHGQMQLALTFIPAAEEVLSGNATTQRRGTPASSN